MGAAGRTLLEIFSLMGWWLYAAKTLFFEGGALMSLPLHGCCLHTDYGDKAALVFWENTMLTHWDAVLNKIRANISYESMIELLITPIYHSIELFLPPVVYRAAEKLSSAL